MHRRRLMLAVAALPVAGCVPAPYGAYFRPGSDAPSRLLRAWCQGQAGPTTRIEQDLAPGTTLVASVERAAADRPAAGWTLHVRLDLDSGAACRHAGDAPRLVALEGGADLAATASVRARRQVTLARHDLVEPDALHPTGGIVRAVSGPAVPLSRLDLVGPVAVAPQRLRLDTPGLQVAGRLAPLAGIEMHRVPDRSVRTFYREPALQAELEACRAAPAGGRCAQRLFDGFAGFERTDGPVRWRGQWDHFENRHDRRPVHGRIEVLVAGGRAWRWADGSFTLHDLDTGVAHALEGDTQTVEFDDAVDLATPWRPLAHPAKARSALWIEVPLPADAPGFELRWPALAIDGRPVDPAPIRFERRSFDGGFEPFNC